MQGSKRARFPGPVTWLCVNLERAYEDHVARKLGKRLITKHEKMVRKIAAEMPTSQPQEGLGLVRLLESAQQAHSGT